MSNIKERKTLILSEFLGIDTSNSSTRVAKNRAVSMKNFINIDGVTKKRNGYETVSNIALGNVVGYFHPTLNGISLKIAFVDNYIYVSYPTADNDVENTYSRWIKVYQNSIILDNFIDKKVSMFVLNEVAYFIGCGDFLCGKIDESGAFKIHKVIDNPTVPTVLTNISHIECDENIAVQWISDKNRLSNKVKVKLIGNDAVIEENGSVHYGTYKLPYLIDESVDAKIHIELLNNTDTSINLVKSKSIKVKSFYDRYTKNRAIIEGDNVGKKTIFFKNYENLYADYYDPDLLQPSIGIANTNKPFIANQGNIYLKWDDKRNEQNEWIGAELNYYCNKERICKVADMDSNSKTKFIIASISMPKLEDVIVEELGYFSIRENGVESKVDVMSSNLTMLINAYIDDYYEEMEEFAEPFAIICTDNHASHIRFLLSTKTVEKEANITIEYNTLAMSDNYVLGDEIAKSLGGATYGFDGNDNRLFLYGANNNTVYYSEVNDFTNFGENNIIKCGSNNNKIIGMHRLFDGSMGVFKTKSNTEPNLYTLSYSLVTSGIYGASESYPREIFPARGWKISESLVGEVVDLAGDILMICKGGVYGLASSTNVASKERFARERSKHIEHLLKSHDLSKSKAIVFDNRLYLAIDNKVYVADARYKSVENSNLDDTFNYEWWVWDNVPVTFWVNINNELHFTTPYGQLMRFNEKYVDENIFLSDEIWGITIGDNNKIYCYYKIKELIKKGTKIVFNSDIYSNNPVFEYQIASYDPFGDGSKVNCMKVSKEIYNEYEYLTTKLYYKNEIDEEIKECACIGIDGYLFLLEGNRFIENFNNLFWNIKGKEFYAKETLYNNHWVDLYDKNGNEVLLYNYANIKNINIAIINNSSVECEWITPEMDMGTTVYEKTILAMAVSAEQELGGELTVGFETRTTNSIIDVIGLDYFDISNFNLNHFSFNKKFANSYTKKLKHNFNFIRFCINSNNDQNCCLNSLTIVYKINKRNKGVN